MSPGQSGPVRHWLRTIVGIGLALGLVGWGFIEGRGEAAPEADQEQPIRAAQRVSVVNGESVITLDDAAQRGNGIKTATLTNGPRRQEVRAYGTVLDLQPLTDLANRYTNAKIQLAMARAKLAASQTAFERVRKLYQDRQNMSAAQLQAAEAAFRVDQAGLAAAESQLRTLAVTVRQGWGPVFGDAIVNDTSLLEGLLTAQKILIQLTLRAGQTIMRPPASATVQLDDGSSLPLHFVSAATRTDPRVQGLSFFFTAPAARGLLPGMSVVAALSTGFTVDGAVVPPAAIVWDEGRAWAYFRTGPETFVRRAVATDRPTPDGGYIVPGISDNAEIVVEGAQMLLSEEFRTQGLPDAGD